MFVFDAYEAGRSYGEHSLVLSPDLCAAWEAEFGTAQGGTRVPASMLSLVVMRAYFAVITPRPPGNVHAGQSFSVQRLPRRGTTVVTEVCCLRKEMRKTRRIVWLGFKARDEDGALFTAEMTSLVAA